MLQLNEIAANELVELVFLGALIFLSQKLVGLLVGKWIKKEQQQALFSLYIPITFNLIWTIYALFSIYQLILINPVFALFVSVLAVVVTFNYVKDFVQGTLFRIQKGNLVGQRIKIDDFSGEVIKMNTTHLDVQLDNGEIAQYPYGRITHQVMAISTDSKEYIYCTFNVRVPFTNEVDNAKKMLHAQILSIPWIISTMQLKTELIHQDPEQLEFKINAYTLDEKFISKIQQALDLMGFQ
jgi:small-conductance mechanosensitive channel